MKKKTSSALIGSVLALLLVGSADAAPMTYSLSELAPVGGHYSNAISLNSTGQIVGISSLPGDLYSQAVVWNDSASVIFRTEGIITSINESGQVAGYFNDRYGNRAFLGDIRGWRVDLGDPLQNSIAYDLNNFGQVVGSLQTNGAPVATLWSDSAPTALGPLDGTYSAAYAVNDIGVIVGTSDFRYISSRYRATLWTNGVRKDLGTLGGNNSFAVDINSSGVIVGGAENLIGTQRPVLWREGVIVDIGPTWGGGGYAAAINTKGDVVGWNSPVSSPNLRSRATLWTEGQAFDLNDLVQLNFSTPGWLLTSAVDISDLGWIVGDAINEDTGGVRGFLLKPTKVVSEPATLSMMMLVGLLYSCVSFRSCRLLKS